MTARYAVVVITLVASVFVAVTIALSIWNPDSSRELETAAVAQYEQRGAHGEITVDSVRIWGDCALVDLTTRPGPSFSSLIMTRIDEDDDWRIARASDDPGADFDDTDEMTSQRECLSVIDDLSEAASAE